MTFIPRIDYAKVAPDAYAALEQLDTYVKSTSLPRNLLELVKLRASQINGCVYCIKYHSSNARKLGESEERIWLLEVWQRVANYTPKERVALAWTESVTLVSETHIPDEIYEEARKYFDEKELIDLTMAIIAINGWNRLSIAMRDNPPA